MALLLAISGTGVPAGLVFAGAWVWPLPSLAQGIEGQVRRLNDLTMMTRTLEIVALEGVAGGRELGADLLGNPADPAWLQALARVYDAGRMQQIYDASLADALAADPGLVDAVAPFLSSALGGRILELEIEARRTVIDEGAKAAAGREFARIKAERGERLALLERLVVAADMIESNVMSGLNGNLAFLKAMALANPEGAGEVDERSLLALVWENEPEIRAELIDFLYPVMALAYAPLSEVELGRYVGFMESPEGKRLTRVLTLTFEAVMQDLAHRLGTEAGRAVSGQVL